MRHIKPVHLYDNNPLDADILDFLADNDKITQDLLRTMLRAGYSLIVQKKSIEASILATVDQADLSSLIIGLLQPGGVAPQVRPKVASHDSPGRGSEKKKRAPKKERVSSPKDQVITAEGEDTLTTDKTKEPLSGELESNKETVVRSKVKVSEFNSLAKLQALQKREKT